MSPHSTKAQPRSAPSGRPFYAHFTDVAAAAGLVAPIVYGYPDHKDYILEAVGCGCAFLDYDNDGWMDIFVLSGTRMNSTPAGATNRLYKNNRDGTFTDVTDKAGLHDVGWASGVCVGDYNNDGFEDLFCTYFGQNKLYRNNGDGTFTDVTKQAGLSNDNAALGRRLHVSWIITATAISICSSLITSSLTSNTSPSPGRTAIAPGRAVAVECGPRGLPHGVHSLYRNNGDGTFTDVSVQAGISSASRELWHDGSFAADFDDDGWPDIFVACDSTPSLLFMNNHDGTFREEGVIRGVALSEDGEEQAGMGVGVGDYDLDGQLDLFKTHFSDDTNGLYHNDGKGNFEDVTRVAGSVWRTAMSAGGPELWTSTTTAFPTFSWSPERLS